MMFISVERYCPIFILYLSILFSSLRIYFPTAEQEMKCSFPLKKLFRDLFVQASRNEMCKKIQRSSNMSQSIRVS